MKKILKTPIKSEDIKNIRIGDIIYLDGYIITCRDVAHRRVIEQNKSLPVNLNGLAIYHAGPIVEKDDNNKYTIVSIGPTTSMRMEKFQKEFIEKTGVKLIIGKGGMGAKTAEACKKEKSLHCIFPGGCGVLAATKVEEVENVEWAELGMPEALWILKVKEFGPLIVSIDTEGNNLFENNKSIFNKGKKGIIEEISKQVGFIR